VLFALLIDSEATQFFFNRCSFQCENPEPGAKYLLVAGDRVMADGVILEYAPPQNILMTFQQYWDPEIKDPPGRVRLTVTERPPLCELTVVHDRLTEGSALNADLDDSWLMMVSGLKTMIEARRIMPLRDEEVAALESEATQPGAEATTAAAAP